MGRSLLYRLSGGLVAAALLTSTTVACSEPRVASDVLVETRSDSAGVEVVLLSGDASSLPVFATVGTADLRLGSPTGTPEEQFGAVRDAVPLPGGGVAILDGQAAEVRLFDRDGQYRGTLGSKGEGPGEFQSPSALATLPGDTIAVFDPTPRRITRFGPDGALARVTTLGDEEDFFADARFLDDGSLVGQSHWLAPNEGGPLSLEPRLIRNTVVLTLFDASGQLVDTIDIVPSAEEVVSIERRAGGLSVFKRAPVFARDNVFAVQSSGVWSSENDRFELRSRDLSGRLLRVVRAPFLDRAADSEMAHAIRDRAMAEVDTPAERAQLDMWYDLSPQPEAQPAFDMFEVDDRGRLWVRSWSPFGESTRWWVVDGDGALLGSADLAAGFRITSISCGAVLGIEQDELGVDYVVRYPINAVVSC